MRRVSDRIAGTLIAGLAVWYALAAGQFQAGFSDQLGPSAFPRLVAVPLGVLALVLVVRPDPEPAWPRGAVLLRQAGAVSVLVAYAMILETAGFMAATLAAVLFAPDG